MTSFNLIFPKSPISRCSHIRVRASTYEFSGDTIQCIALSLLWITHLGEESYDIQAGLWEPTWWKTESLLATRWGSLRVDPHLCFSLQMKLQPRSTEKWETLGHSQPAKPCLDPCPHRNCELLNICCFTLSYEVIWHGPIENEHINASKQAFRILSTYP